MADDKKNELTTSTALTAIDPFDWEPDDLVPSTNEDDGELRRMRSFDGDALARFVHPEGWTVDGIGANLREVILREVRYWIIRWPNRVELEQGMKGPAETLPVLPGGPVYDLKAMNEAIPKAQWNGKYGKPPYQMQRVLEFLDPVTLERISWLHYTEVKGARAAWREIKGRMSVVRDLRGIELCPVVRLNEKPFPNDFKPLNRPWLEIVRWARFTKDGIEYVDVSKPLNPPTLPRGATAQLEQFAAAELAKPAQQTKPIEPTLIKQSDVDVPLTEELEDEIPYR